MIKAPIGLQDLRRRIYAKAKAEPSWRFWGLYVHVCKMETLQAAYKLAKENNGAPGVDGVTFESVESAGRAEFLEQLREELVTKSREICRRRALRARILRSRGLLGGAGRIRTDGTLAGTPAFKAGAFDHSATAPGRKRAGRPRVHPALWRSAFGPCTPRRFNSLGWLQSRPELPGAPIDLPLRDDLEQIASFHLVGRRE